MERRDEMQAFAQHHIQNKYGDCFETVSFTAKNIDMPYDEIVMKDPQGNRFAVYIEEHSNGNVDIQDGYYGILKAEEYRQMVKAVLDRHLANYKFFSRFTAHRFNYLYDGNFALAEALKATKRQFFSNTYVFISEEDAGEVTEATYAALSQELEESGLTLYIAVYLVSNEALKDIDETKDVNLFLPSDYRVNPAFKKTIG